MQGTEVFFILQLSAQVHLSRWDDPHTGSLDVPHAPPLSAWITCSLAGNAGKHWKEWLDGSSVSSGHQMGKQLTGFSVASPGITIFKPWKQAGIWCCNAVWGCVYINSCISCNGSFFLHSSFLSKNYFMEVVPHFPWIMFKYKEIRPDSKMLGNMSPWPVNL